MTAIFFTKKGISGNIPAMGEYNQPSPIENIFEASRTPCSGIEERSRGYVELGRSPSGYDRGECSPMKLPDQPTQVFLLIENRLVRETLVRLFRKRSDVCVVGQCSHTETPALPSAPCDVVVLDDLEIASAIGESLYNGQHDSASIGLVLIAMEEEEEPFLTAVRFGVSGYLLNDASPSDVVAAVRAVGRGEAVCPPRLCRALLRSVAQGAREMPPQIKRGPTLGLTIRQQQLISLVAKGLTNKEIASQLNLSEFTIKNHIHRIMKQVEAESRYEVVAAARASGYIAFA
jgi:DNA-binding NarL/FixJ family response regulator